MDGKKVMVRKGIETILSMTFIYFKQYTVIHLLLVVVS